jgi:hypothetical protein
MNLWNSFTAVSIKDVFLDYAPCSTSLNRPFGERIFSIFRFPQLHYRGNAVTYPPDRRTQLILEDHCLRFYAEAATVTQLWKPINLRNPEDGDDTFSETSVQASATRYQAQEDIFYGHRREIFPGDSGLPILRNSVPLWGG